MQHATGPRRGRLLAAALLAAAIAPAARAGDSPVVTLVRGASTLFSGTHGYLPAPGVRLQRCDVIRTGPQASVHIEFADRTRIELGPETSFVAALHSGDAPAAGRQFLLTGWAKVTVPRRDKAPPHRVDTPHFDLVFDDGVAVVHVDARGGQFFVERGRVLTRPPFGVVSAPTPVTGGSTYQRRAGQPGSSSPHPDPAMVAAMPRSYRDTVPILLPRLGPNAVQPKAVAGARFADVDDALEGEPELRSCRGGGTVVRDAQEALQRAGLDVGAIDGVFGPRTQAALREYQRRSGLARSGELDAPTLQALDVAERR